MMQVERPSAISAMHYRHLEIGAEMVEHEGWTLPARYTDPEEEATRVREGVGIVDFSHIGKIRLQGDSVDEALSDYKATPVGSVSISGDTVVARLTDDDCLILTGQASVDHVLDSL
ncbi:MAG: hypothetical protein OXI33_13705, partial [Chloroflexota bacterium]|nr:hypothetical protein [Chloroflexota bacterium]